MSIIIHKPLDKPTLSVARNPGAGNFVAGNYEFSVLVDASPATFYNGAVWCSDWATPQAITLENGDGVDLTWGNIDTNGIRVFICARSPQRWTYFEWYYGTDIQTNYGTGALLSNYPTGGTITYYWFSSRQTILLNFEADGFYFGMSPQKGIGMIEVDNTHTVDLYVDDIYDAIVASSDMVAHEDYVPTPHLGIITNYSLNMRAVSSPIDFQFGIKILFFWGGIDNQGSNVTLNGVNSVIINAKRGGFGASGNLYNCNITASSINRAYIYYSSGGRLWGEPSGPSYTISGGTIEKSFIVTGWGGFSNESVDNIWSTSAINVYPNEVPTRQYTLGNNAQIYGQNTMTIPDVTFDCNTDYGIFNTVTGNGVNSFLNCRFIVNGEEVQGFPGAYVYNYPTTDYKSEVRGGNRVNVTVQSGGELIEDATVIMADKDGTEVFNVLTDQYGVITEQEVYHWHHVNLQPSDYRGTDPVYQINTDYNPYTLVVTKNGYNPYVFENITITEDLTFEAVLGLPTTYVPLDITATLEEEQLYAKV